jgi:ABC-2 type transport system ATP-binding protein
VNIIETTDLTKTYPGGVQALRGVSLSVRKGEVYGLLGPNGAGKTTTVRVLNGTLAPDGGSFSVLGHETASSELRLKTATMSESARMYESLSVEQNLRFFAALYEMEPAAAERRIGELLERMQLRDRRYDKLGALSTGLKKRLQLARTLLHSPELLFLDEPASGLDPDSAGKVNALIRTLADEYGTTVLLCTHNLPLAEQICDSFGFLSEGLMVQSGRKENIIDSLTDGNTVRVTTGEGEVIERSFEAEEEINRILTELISEGRIITGVAIPKPSLEEAYFHYIGRSEHELV